MKLTRTLLFASTLILFSCGNDTEYNETQGEEIIEIDHDEFSLELDELELKISEDPSNEELLKEAITKFQDFAGLFPEDENSPDYLLKASDFSLAIKQPESSVKILDAIISKHPDYDKMEDVMYVRADHLDWELRDTTRAKQAYQDYIDAYPDSQRAADAALRIKFIAMSFEEYAEKIISEFEAGS